MYEINYKEIDRPIESIKIYNEGFSDNEYVKVGPDYEDGNTEHIKISITNDNEVTGKSFCVYFLNEESVNDLITALKKIREEL